jgi:hypothetical protein
MNKKAFKTLRFAQVLILCSLATICAGCRRTPPPQNVETPAGPPRIQSIAPVYTIQNTGFNVQPSGESILVVDGSDFPAGATVNWNGKPLKTTPGPGWRGAVVPNILFAEPSIAEITIKSPDGTTSNVTRFEVFGKTGPAPQITGLDPKSAINDTTFNTQPGDKSVLLVLGSNFLPKATVLLNGKPTETAFASGAKLHAIIPRGELKTVRKLRIQVVNPDGRKAEETEFSVTAKP